MNRPANKTNPLSKVSTHPATKNADVPDSLRSTESRLSLSLRIPTLLLLKRGMEMERKVWRRYNHEDEVMIIGKIQTEPWPGKTGPAWRRSREESETDTKEEQDGLFCYFFYIRPRGRWREDKRAMGRTVPHHPITCSPSHQYYGQS